MAHVFTNGIHKQIWDQIAPAPNAHAAGMGMCSDLRNDRSRNPFVYQLASNTVLNRYNGMQKSWNFIVSPALAGTFGAGAGCVFAPSHGLTGTISTGCTTMAITTSTAITAVAPNMFANRGGAGEYGFRVRITGKVSGKTEEKWIVANTGGTTPTLYLDSALTFTPASGDTYEILGGRVFMLGAGTLASGSWKSFEVAANTLATKTQTNLPATVSTEFSAIALDELYVPYDREPGEGMIVGASTYNNATLKCLLATAVATSTITGQASAGDAAVLANEYRNFQIRIVEDTTTPAAVGQRRIIASHTAGPSAVYTLGSAWTTNPSANAKFVIELPNLIVLWSSGGTTTYTYNYGTASVTNGTNTIAADAWSTTYFSVRGAAMAAGCTSFASFGIEPDAQRNARHSYIYSFRGGSTSLDLFDIANTITGAWTSAIVYDGSGMATPGAGTCGQYSPVDQEGRYGYINGYVASQISQMYRFDVKNRVLTCITPTEWLQTGTAAVGDRVATYAVFDTDSTPYTAVLLNSHLSTVSFELIVEI